MPTITMTLAEVEARHGVTHLDHLDRQAHVPVIDQLGLQGDVAVVAAPDRRAANTPIPATGYPVVRGENGGNTHTLIGRGLFTPAAPRAGELTLGVLTVPAEVEVLLSHPEHGALLIAPGTYQVRRQREQANEVRLVAD